MNLDALEYTFSYTTLILLLVLTFGSFYLLVRKTTNLFKKYFLIVFSVSFFIYSGLGASILDDQGLYISYYLSYCLVLVLSLYLFRDQSINIKMDDEQISTFIEKRGNVFILIYTFLAVLLLIFPENKLNLLLTPPLIDISGVMGDVTREDTMDSFTSIVFLIKNIIFPLYFLSLIKYVKKPIQLLLIIIIPLYITFCKDEYIARSVFGLYFLFYMSVLYYFNEKYRKTLLISTIIIVLSSITFLAAFTALRKGESVNMNFLESINALFVIEGTFPSWFVDIYNNSLESTTYIKEYILWIVTQPFPGFMKSWLVDFYLNISIAQVLLGLDITETVSYVPLVGLVSESVFIFGNKLFFIHAIILGYLLNIFSNFLISKNSFKIIAIYAIVFTCMSIGRAGTGGSDSYAFMIKTIVFLPFFLYLFTLKFER